MINEVYQYDSLGNRTSDQNGSYSYDQTGQKLQEDYRYFYYYDNSGNLSSKIDKSTNLLTSFFYDSENKLIAYKEFDQAETLLKNITYEYDALGRRIEKVVTDNVVPANNKTRRYVYDGQDILLVLDENNDTLAKYTHSTLRIDDVLAIDNKTDSKSYFYLKDHLGSVVDIADNQGAVKQHYIYSSFGEIQKVTDANGIDISASPLLEHHFAYTGREWDSESGLYHYRARAYDARVGRFLQTDPHPGSALNPLTSTNKYIYVTNDPLNNTDPSGRIKFRNIIAINIAFGAGVGLGAMLGPIGGASLGALVGGEVSYRTNRLLGGSKEESHSLRSKGKIAGAIGGLIGGLGSEGFFDGDYEDRIAVEQDQLLADNGGYNLDGHNYIDTFGPDNYPMRLMNCIIIPTVPFIQYFCTGFSLGA